MIQVDTRDSLRNAPAFLQTIQRVSLMISSMSARSRVNLLKKRAESCGSGYRERNASLSRFPILAISSRSMSSLALAAAGAAQEPGHYSLISSIPTRDRR